MNARTRERMNARTGLVQRVLHSLELSLQGAQESEGAGTVEDAVVEAQTAVHHAAHGDGIVGGDYGAFDDRFHRHDASLADRHDRLTHDRAKRSRVVDGERRTLEIVDPQ